MWITGWNGRNRVTLQTGEGNGAGSNAPASIIPIPPKDTEVPYLIENGVWLLIDWEESERHTWSGVIQVNNQNWHLFIPR